MIDARIDLAGAINALQAEIAALRAEKDERRYCAAAAARKLGYGKNYFAGKPWRVPGFGRAGMSHSMRAWVAWLNRPEGERRAEWDAIPLRERGKLRGAA